MTVNNYQSVSALSEAIRAGRQSIPALLEGYLARIEAENTRYHAFKTVLADQARADAKRLQAEVEAGQWRGPLHGIPVAVKDNIDIAGQVASAGSLSGAIPEAAADALVISRLRDAGAIIIGQTHMVEFAFGGWGTNTAMGTPRNPLDPTHHRVPGGSSSGSAVAVAADLVPLALGTDTGGSVRIPASMNGLTGFKPSWGRVPDAGLVPLCQRFDVVGPLAHSVADCWTLFEAMTSEAGQDIRPIPKLDRPLRIGVADAVAYGSYSARVLAAFKASCDKLAASGLQLEPFTLPVTVQDVLSRTGVLIGGEAVTHFGGLLPQARDKMDIGMRNRLEDAQVFTAEDQAREWQRRDEAAAQMQAQMAGFDALLFPTTPILPPRLDEIIERAMPLGDLTRVVNYLDLCAMALPTQTTAEGLRHSLQIIGAKGADELIFALSAKVESVLGHLPEAA